MQQQVFAITGNKIASMLAGETSLLFSSQHFTSAKEFQEAWDKKLSLATKVEVKYEAIKSIHKDADDADILIKYKTFLGVTGNCQFSFDDPEAYPVFFAFLQKERYFSKQEESLTPLKASANYLIGMAVALAFTALCYWLALDGAHDTTAEEHDFRKVVFRSILRVLGANGVLAVGALALAYLGYKAWQRFTNPPSRLLFLPLNA